MFRIDRLKHTARAPIPALVLFCALLLSTFSPALAFGAGFTDVIESQRAAVETETAGQRSTYTLDAAFTPARSGQLAEISGSLALHFINTTGVNQSTLPFRLYPNSAIYPAVGMSIECATVRGIPTAIALSVYDTVAALALPAPVAPGSSTDVLLSFTTRIPIDPRGTYGMFSFDTATGIYALANWFPILAGFDPETGWLLEPPAEIGDPVFTNAAMFDVHLTAPWQFKIAAGGTELDFDRSSLLPDHHYVSGPARDFVLAISDLFQTASVNVGETIVTSYFLPEDAVAGGNALLFGSRALTMYGARYGIYPYRTMALVEMPLGSGAGGVEFPQLVYLGSDYYRNDTETGPPSLDFLVSHEVAHQWFYGLVGNDQYRHAFLDEALANTLAVFNLETFRGADAAALVIDRSIAGPYRDYLERHGDLVVDAPSDGFPSVTAYNAIVYGKAVLGFQAIRDRIGQTTFDAGLARYVARHRFTTAAPGDLLSCLNDASGQDLTTLWNHWFEEAHGLTDLNIASNGTPASGPGS